MRTPNPILAGACVLAAMAAHAGSSLDGHPSVTQYLSNEAPFVVFGVTPTRLNPSATSLQLTFIATDPLDQVHVFPFVRRTADGPARLRPHVACGPRDPGSWDCPIPVADLLRSLSDGGGELGLRIEAHGDLRARGQHSTVIVTVPVQQPPTATRNTTTLARGIKGPALPAQDAVPPRSAEGAPQNGAAAQRRRGVFPISD